jgi:Family of unknown function (DUF5677)
MRSEHRTVHLKLVRLWNQIAKHKPTDDRERILLLQCQAIWDIVDSMRLLVQKKRGVAAFILSRSIFEYSAVADVLARSSDPQLLTDYIDSGKLVLYEADKAMGADPSRLAGQQKEYDTIKTRMGRRKWHGGRTIEDLVNKSQHGQVLQPGESGLYKTFYKEASSLSHGDSYVFLSHSPKNGWLLTFDKADRAEWGVRGLSLTYQVLAATLHTVQDALGMDLNQKFQALIPDLETLPA